ncbi:metalloregulator ArsR/SmtB family transcription factor [Nonomuraea sp. NPDC049649]|uniref:ArsR/SmtB family transcription factor n=1 Tax=Nonomuraea sp. NPDC049649 TaxID=3155776 RepID=UPI0034322106
MATSQKTAPESPTEIFKALGDPIRWKIVQQMAAVDELACSTLEDTLPVSKPTISYHTKILTQAGLIDTRKEGRNYYYTLRREVLHHLVDEMWALAPAPRPVRDGKIDHAPEVTKRRGGRRQRAAERTETAERDLVLLTW